MCAYDGDGTGRATCGNKHVLIASRMSVRIGVIMHDVKMECGMFMCVLALSQIRFVPQDVHHICEFTCCVRVLIDADADADADTAADVDADVTMRCDANTCTCMQHHTKRSTTSKPPCPHSHHSPTATNTSHRCSPNDAQMMAWISCRISYNLYNGRCVMACHVHHDGCAMRPHMYVICDDMSCCAETREASRAERDSCHVMLRIIQSPPLRDAPHPSP